MWEHAEVKTFVQKSVGEETMPKSLGDSFLKEHLKLVKLIDENQVYHEVQKVAMTSHLLAAMQTAHGIGTSAGARLWSASPRVYKVAMKEKENQWEIVQNGINSMLLGTSFSNSTATKFRSMARRAFINQFEQSRTNALKHPFAVAFPFLKKEREVTKRARATARQARIKKR